jgi:DNA-binding HxlR family transcriptional regulator
MEMNQMREKCFEVAALMKHFSHPQRLLILCYLSDGEKQVQDIQLAAGLSQSQTSQFLKRMQAEGLLSLRRNKNCSYYSLANAEVRKVLKSMHRIFCKS